MYKRQVEDEPFEDTFGILHHEEGIDLLPANIELSGMEVSPVSYTHLDVYKRQIKNNLAAFGHPKAFELSEDGFHWLGDYESTADEVLGGIAPKARCV